MRANISCVCVWGVCEALGPSRVIRALLGATEKTNRIVNGSEVNGARRLGSASGLERKQLAFNNGRLKAHRHDAQKVRVAFSKKEKRRTREGRRWPRRGQERSRTSAATNARRACGAPFKQRDRQGLLAHNTSNTESRNVNLSGLGEASEHRKMMICMVCDI